MTGQIAMYFGGMPIGLPLVKAGRLRALAVTTAKRSNAAPDVPTMAEAGVTGYEHSLWAMLMVPAATPREIVVRLSGEAVKAVEASTVRDRLSGMGVDAVGTTPEQASAYLKSEIAKYAKVVKAIGLKLE